MSIKTYGLSQGIESTFKKYIEVISNKYNINHQELINLWNEQNDYTTTNMNNDINLEILTKEQLVSMCKSKGLKYSGSKKVLIGYLNGEQNGIAKKTITKNKDKEKEVSTPDNVIKKIVANIPTISITKNSFGNFEHKDSQLLFNNKTRQVIGKQNPNGNIDILSKEDIDLCNRYKFIYVMPENLDNNIKDDDDILLNVEDEKEEKEEEEEEEEIDDIIEEQEEYEEEYEEDF